MCRETPPGHVFVVSLAEIDPRKVAEVVRRSHDKKNNASATHFFALSPKPIVRRFSNCGPRTPGGPQDDRRGSAERVENA